MRKVRLGAIQPHYPSLPPEYNCVRENFSADPQEIFEKALIPYIELTAGLLEQAGEAGCGAVTTCEDLCGTAAFLARTGTREEGNLFPDLLELTAPYAEERIAGIARRYQMNIIACYNRREGGKNYNQAAVFNREGGIVGSYRKTHLPPNEMWQVEAGTEFPVFDLDFGRVGVSICYDMMFPEMCQSLSLKGAEVVFHPTAGYGWYDSIGEATLRTRANDGDFYLVTAKNYIWNAAGHSSVIDYWGQVLADAGFYENAVVFQDVDLDIPKTQPEWFYPSQVSGFAGIHPRKLRERQPHLYGELTKPAEPLAVPTPEEQAVLLEKMRDGRCHW